MTPRRLERALARGLIATRGVDTAYKRFDRARSRAVVRWAPEAMLADLNALAYERDDVYHPARSAFRSRLFPWEAAAVRDHFPPAPARVLIGGAGGGREPFALARQGYEVVAFEPAPELATAMAVAAQSVPGVRAYRAGYEDLPRLAPAAPGSASATLPELGQFDASVLGWGSFSHLRSRAARVAALTAFGAATTGPILVSFLDFRSQDGATGVAATDRRAENFSVFIGYYHSVGTAELTGLVREAGLEIVALNTDETDSTWPHAIVRRAALTSGS